MREREKNDKNRESEKIDPLKGKGDKSAESGWKATAFNCQTGAGEPAPTVGN